MRVTQFLPLVAQVILAAQLTQVASYGGTAKARPQMFVISTGHRLLSQMQLPKFFH